VAIDFDALTRWEFEEQQHPFTRRDTILYALGVGLGFPACDPDQLPFLYEEELRALPTMAVVLGYRGFWMKDPATGIDWKKVLHSGQAITVYQPLPVDGVITSRLRISALIDKGRDRGAILAVQRQICSDRGERLATVEQVSLLRGDGGFGRSYGAVEPTPSVPTRPADTIVDLRTFERSALIYRLSGDYNPLHIDPRVAGEAGFPRPILHGLCTFGVIGHALLKGPIAYRTERFHSLKGRFTNPVYPGDTIRTELWMEAARRIAIRARALERDVVVFDSGVAELKT